VADIYDVKLISVFSMLCSSWVDYMELRKIPFSCSIIYLHFIHSSTITSIIYLNPNCRRNHLQGFQRRYIAVMTQEETKLKVLCENHLNNLSEKRMSKQ